MPERPLFEPDEATETEGTVLEKATDEVPVVGTAPEPDEVAGRALMLGALLERARLEAARDEARLGKLKRWVDHFGLLGHLGASGVELFDEPLGQWSDEDLATVEWCAEELQMLRWAMGTAPFPKLDVRADGRALLEGLPLVENAKAFFEQATRRPLDELETRLALCDSVLEAVRAEVYARALGSGSATVEEDEALVEVLDAAEARGFKRDASRSATAEAIEGLRFTVRVVLGELFDDASPHLEHRIDSAGLVGLDDTALATLLATVQSRADALAWMIEGEATEEELEK